MNRAFWSLVLVTNLGCSNIVGDVLASAGARSDAGALTAPAAPPVPSAPTAKVQTAPPRDVPTFLTRFCEAVATADKAYVLAHADTTFSSSMGPDPEAPRRGRTKNYGGVHHAGDTNFNPVCTRVRAQPAGEIARRVREQNGVLLVRLRHDGMASDLVIERNGADFRLLREEEPGGRTTAPRPAAGGGGGGW